MSYAEFADRAEAARRLAGALRSYHGTRPLVLAIPRGGVPIARVIADALGGDLDVVLVRKLGAPGNPEFAIGAIDESGEIRLGRHARTAGADERYVRQEARQQLELIRSRRALYTPHRPPIDPRDRTVIVVDDGLATGATMAAALAGLRAQHPARLVCAVPVGAPDNVDAMAELADEVVCLDAPEDFYAVGQFYADFSAVSDDEVIRALQGTPRPAAETYQMQACAVRIPAGTRELDGDLAIPPDATALVVFVHGSGSSRKSPRNRFVATALNRHGLATLLFDLLTEAEDRDRAARFDIALLTERLRQALEWARRDTRVAALPLGLFGASTGAAAALDAAAMQATGVGAVVSRGGRPDLADARALATVVAPTLLIVGGDDTEVIELNEQARRRMRCRTELAIVPGATHLFEEPGALERVAELAAAWFQRWLAPAPGKTQRRRPQT